jgi:nucleotide-binding universal stress UspA family protein
VYGRAARVILELASAEGADVIVLGSRGLSDLAGLVLGSVTHKVLHLAHCPVLVVR